MRKLTEKEIARLLAARATPEPPSGLADRIKAEIPGSIRIERRPLHTGRRWLLPPLVEGLQPTWLAAASILMVLGVGIVAARIPAQPDDVWKWMALSGVVHIDDVVVTAPQPLEPARTLVAAAPAPRPERQRAAASLKGAAARPEAADALETPAGDAGAPAEAAFSAAAASEPAVGALEVNVSAGHAALPGASVTALRADAPDAGPHTSVSDARGHVAMRDLPPGEYRVRSERPGFEPLDATVTVAAGGRARVDFAMPQSAPRPVVAAAADVETARRGARVAAPAAVRAASERESGVTVTVLGPSGEPLEGATVTLERIGQGAMWTRTARTEADGTATFRGVPPSTYRALVVAEGVTPAQLVVSVTSDREPTRAEVRLRPLARR